MIAIYCRVSTVHQKDKDSLPMQRKSLISYANLLLHTNDYEVFEDAGFSGKNFDRPQFKRMMEGIRKGRFTHLLVWKIDRISRNLLDFATLYTELKKLKVTFISQNEQFDTSTPMGEAMLKIILVFAELERNMTSERVTATMVSRAQSGKWNGGRIPYGYNYSKDAGFSLNEDEAEVVKYIHNRYEELRSLVLLSHEMNHKHITTRSGNPFSPTALCIILNNYFYCGDYMYNVHKEGKHTNVKEEADWVHLKNHHVGFISHEQKERIIKTLSFNDRMKPEDRKRSHFYNTRNVHVFNGMCYCARCGKNMYATPVKKKWIHSNYLCPTRRLNALECDQPTVSDQKIGDIVFNVMLRMMRLRDQKIAPQDWRAYLENGLGFSIVAGMDELADIMRQDRHIAFKPKYQTQTVQDHAELLQKRAKTERAIERLTNIFLYADDVMSDEEYVARKNALTQELAEIDEKLDTKEEATKETQNKEFVTASSDLSLRKAFKKDRIDYKELAQEVEPSVLRAFTEKTIERIELNGDKVVSLTFLNGLHFVFAYE